MKKVIISIIIIITFITSFNITVYAEQDGQWVSDAFKASSEFLHEGEIKDDLGIVNPLLSTFKDIIKAINMVLLALLAGLSMISLAITGVRYLASGASPKQKEVAKESLHTIFIGMVIGFGAFTIWQIAISIVVMVVDNLA